MPTALNVMTLSQQAYEEKLILKSKARSFNTTNAFYMNTSL